MKKKNSVFIATSIDGYISDKNGGIDWLYSIPNPAHIDMGYAAFIQGIDALVMGRKTFETVLGFEVDWPYEKPVFVLSNTLKAIPASHKGKAFLLKGSLREILTQLHAKGLFSLYIDGGSTIRGFLKEDLIDEMILTSIPVLLGGGASLFTALPHQLEFELIGSNTYLDQITQHHYRRKR
ncbi:MAG: dihydrofolate reductase [Bacteroidetes bacterium]|nr:MAG: dihydrofolate reductase [Bacteroidota bacterium]